MALVSPHGMTLPVAKFFRLSPKSSTNSVTSWQANSLALLVLVTVGDQANIKATDKRAIKWVKMEWLIQLERTVAKLPA
jgi:hypothetical protein